MDGDQLEEIYNSTKGQPGHLASIRRILKHGTSPSDLVHNLPEKLPQLFELEWTSVDGTDSVQRRLLSVLAIDRRPHTLESLAALCGVDVASARRLLEPLGFLHLQSDGSIAFISESFCTFAGAKLSHLRRSTTQALIEDMMKEPSSEQSLMYLPKVLEDAGSHTELLGFLSSETLSNILAKEKAISSLRTPVEQGLRIAHSAKAASDLMRFSASSSFLRSIADGSAIPAEVEALVALKDHGAALALASSAPLVEDRLQMLATVAKGIVHQGLALEKDIVEQIRTLYSEAEVTHLGDRAIDVAADLLYSAPDLANDLVARATESLEDHNARDWAYTRLVLRAHEMELEGRCPPDSTAPLLSRIRNPIAQRFAREVTTFMADMSAREAIEKANAVKDTSDKLFLLRIWCKRNRSRQDAVDVVEFALRTAITTTAYAPNARVYRELAEVLPYCQN